MRYNGIYAGGTGIRSDHFCIIQRPATRLSDHVIQKIVSNEMLSIIGLIRRWTKLNESVNEYGGNDELLWHKNKNQLKRQIT